jgi:hypothetical protein
MNFLSFVAVPITKNHLVRNEAYDLQACRNSKMAILDADAGSQVLLLTSKCSSATIFQVKLKTSSSLVFNKPPSYFGLENCNSAGVHFL